MLTYSAILLLAASLFATPTPINSAKQIVGGVPVEPKFKYSWLVSLQTKSNSFHFCGGTLLNPTTVITAAHCSVGQSASRQKVIAHRHDLGLPLSSENALVFDVTKISTHPSYDRKTNAYDVAIWKVQLVSGDLSLVNSAIISLDDGSQPVADNTTVTIAGWGTVSSSGNSSPILLETQVNILNQEYCQKEYSTLDTTSICAAAPGKDTCQGDSGGPLFTQAADGSVKLIGLTSYGQGCADPSFAGVYSRVSSLMTWINYFVPNPEPQTPNLDDFDKDFNK